MDILAPAIQIEALVTDPIAPSTESNSVGC